MNTCKHLGCLLILLLATVFARAQNLNLDNARDYMTAVDKAHLDMDSKYMQYMSAAAHGRRARKVEKLRQQVLDNISQSRYNTMGCPGIKGIIPCARGLLIISSFATMSSMKIIRRSLMWKNSPNNPLMKCRHISSCRRK